MITRYIRLLLIPLAFMAMPATAQDTNWIRNNTWYFDNFVQEEVSWNVFREAFIGVSAERSADFDGLFYDALFKSAIVKDGHCFGMNALALLLLKNGGHLGFCYPPCLYPGRIFTNPGMKPSIDTLGPADPVLKRAIQIVHGNQINHGFLSFLLDVLNSPFSRDGSYAFSQAQYYISKNDPVTISLTKEFSPQDSGGHSLIGYATEEVGGKKRIYVYDSNRSFYKPGAEGHDFYTNRKNYVEISGQDWQYEKDPGVIWKGNPKSGGHLIIIPISIAGRKDRLPQSLLLEGSYSLNTIFIFGDVTLMQATDIRRRHRYLNDKGTFLETREQYRLRNFLPFTPMGSGPHTVSPKTSAYFVRGQDRLHLYFRSRGDYRIGMLFGGKYTETSVKGDGRIRHFITPDVSRANKGKHPARLASPLRD
ncbi:hypothetical protein [Chitinophaga sp. RAB17]|uniref:hypothetical protein n=1 Tax=Chitinophaga sp. RAB17 TaxID=3233049 RepID=UPI003F916A2A